ncbi:rho GTPase-activating protein SYDE1 [Sceloporus undulatus]|uniref:rho GTPase-activating protein SYDE1 n=1 Tax=Sceloporus undulatus TaxID=8520 RepID=UPI001C4C3226|nr:rho GTPase-activating protein SYDE1 [Sceloporus undulatus]
MQPLLRKTFSRLRAKERLGRKKTLPVAAAAAQEEDSLSEPPGASGCAVGLQTVGSLPWEDGCTKKSTTITVSRKQNWAKFTWSSQEDSHKRKLGQSSSSTTKGPTDQDKVPSQESLHQVGLVASGPKEDTEVPVGYMESCSSSLISAKCSSQGAYLQSLERSSRHWVLSSGKTQGMEEVAATSSSIELKEPHILCSNEGEIWYNPIPEDEDLQPPGFEKKWESVTRKGKPVEIKAGWEDICLGSSQQARRDGFQTSPSQMRPAKQAEEMSNPQPQACGGKMLSASPDPEEKATFPVSGAQSPISHKKVHHLGKAKSPGPVRSLSMKMKKLPELRRKLSLRSSRPRGPEPEGGSSPKEPGSVISRYHLDSSVTSQQLQARGKAASKGGYLSDGDSPELQAKAETYLGLDDGSFRPYSFAEQPGCFQHLSGLVSIHLLGVQDFRPPKAEAKEAFCVLQVDSVNKARTALLPCQDAFLSLNHSFQLELEDSQLLKVVVFSCDPAVGKNRVCCHGTIILPHVFQGCKTQQLAMQLEPRGLLYVKLTLVDQWDPANNDWEPQVFGVKLSQLVEREGAAIKVPLLIHKCITQIEKRGLKVVGLYRLCGSAAVKKELRDAFERDSSAVVLSEDLYPDINVITGILKDYLRELPTPLITNPLYQVVLEAMSSRTEGQEAKETSATTVLLDCLPEAEKATLTMLLDHLSLVASFHTFNRMNAQNLAVCFGPVLLSQGTGGPGARSPRQRHHTIASTMDFKHHIEVLHYLLQAWPIPRRKTEEEHPLPQRQCRPSLNLPLLQTTVVARSRPRGLESPPSNRYAGDWSVCGQQFLAGPKPGVGDTDYDEVAGSESDNDDERNEEEEALREGLAHHSRTVFMGDFALVEEQEAPFSPRLNLKDFDALILDLEQELSKQINVCL